MPKTLYDIIEFVSEVYPDHYLQKHLRQPKRDLANLNDALADYIVTEMRSLYDPNSNDRANLRRITSSLERSVDQLTVVIDRLKALELESQSN